MSSFRALPKSRRLLLLPVVLLVVALAPTVARADTHTFLNTEGYGPSEVGGTVGPANHYPSTVAVSALSGTVTKVTVTTFDLTAGNELDMALVGPNGAQVMLMSDACGSEAAKHDYLTFDDSASQFVNGASCPLGQRGSVLPTNYGDPESDVLSVKGGPSGPFSNQLSAFNGISPNGDWNLFMLDDQAGVFGFEMGGWALTLEVEPPAPIPPTPVIVQVPAPAPISAPILAQTGKRAAALARCKAKKTTKARKSCRSKAQKLPL